jgi:hypothetical protein
VKPYLHSPQYVFMAWCFVKDKDNFTFYLSYVLVFPEIYPPPHPMNVEGFSPGDKPTGASTTHLHEKSRQKLNITPVWLVSLFGVLKFPSTILGNEAV